MLKTTSSFSTIGSRIKYYRLLNDFTQEDLAIKSGLDRSTINRYENDLVNHSLESINIICETLKIKPSIIYDDYLNFISKNHGNKIKFLRKDFKLTQKDLSNILEVHIKTIACWEKEESYPTRYNYMKIIEVSSYKSIDSNY